MNDKEIKNFVEILIPYIIKELKKDKDFRTSVRRKNATVINTTLEEGEHNIDKEVEVILPYDSTSFCVPNKTGTDLITGDLICIEYCIDLKNAVAVYKVN